MKKKINKKRLLIVVGALLAVVAIAVVAVFAFSGKEEPKKKTKEPKVEEPKEPEVANFYPFTGVPTDEPIDARPIGVMISNAPEGARPQTGLSKADIVFEIQAEANYTRFLAIYQSEFPEKFGPVRSSRDYYIEIAKGYGALYIAHGFSPSAKKKLDKGYVDNLNGMYYDGSLFKRSKDRKAPHNSYITFEKIQEGAAKKKYSMTATSVPYSFYTDEEAATLMGTPANEVKVSYQGKLFDATYRYDATSQKYTRFVNGKQTVEYKTDVPILIDNLFVIEMKQSYLDNKGYRKDFDVKSGGKAYLFQRGQMQEVEWQNVDGRIAPFANGEEVKLVMGKTWVNVVSAKRGLQKDVTVK